MIKTFMHYIEKLNDTMDRDEEINTFSNNPYIKVYATQTNVMKDFIITTIFYEKQKK